MSACRVILLKMYFAQLRSALLYPVRQCFASPFVKRQDFLKNDNYDKKAA